MARGVKISGARLTGVPDGLSDLTDIQRVIVPIGTGLWVFRVWVFPGLRESSVVPDVS